MQKLIQPINNMRLTCSYKSPAYPARYNGLIHYGIDCADAVQPFDRTVWSMGKGKVIATGTDSILGNFVVVRYGLAYHHRTSTAEASDLIVRMFHLNSIYVKDNQNVTTKTKLGEYGGSGYGKLNYWAKHLHLEVDTDFDHPMYTPTMAGKSSRFIGSNFGANDKTMSNPMEWIYCKTSAPDNQTYTHDGTAFISAADKTYTTIN